MSKKSELLNVIESYKGKQEVFKNKITEISRNTELSQEGAERRINELAGPFEEIAQNAQDRALEILNSGVEALEKKWKDNSAGRLLDSNYQAGLTNAIKMIEVGAITNQEDFQNIIDVYKDDYNALAILRNLAVKCEEVYGFSVLIPKDNREYNRKSLNDTKNNIERYISPFSIRDSLTMSLENMIVFIKTRLKDDLSIIPWEEMQ